MKFDLKNMKFPRLTLRRGLMIVAGVLLVGIVAMYLAATAFPAIGAQGVDFLRAIIGDQAVAQLETWIFQVQDGIRQIKYSLGLEKPSAPWQAPASAQPAETPRPSLTPTITLTSAPTATPLPEATLAPTETPAPTFTPTPTPWRPTAAQALGSLEGEGAWQPYIKDEKGRTLAFRTYIQPDPKRPYAVVAVVAFDLSRTRLNFILGWDEPSLKDGPKGTGLIPSTDARPGVLLATFNGGFKAMHGNYGAMSGGVVALKPVPGLAMIAIYKDGSVKIGEYGKDITSLDDTVAWRQNCSTIIENGQINPLVNNNSAEFWGANLNGETVTWRSGIGISPDGKTLYYFAGPNMMMPVLASAMQAVGVKAGLQLDINNYWVHFVAMRKQGDNMTPEPLFPDDMKADTGRYLTRYPRDFFYVALKEE